tara:strand:- start:1 stop:363 length:363 start_codon:yes stop_codon:yes gene_type:complete
MSGDGKSEAAANVYGKKISYFYLAISVLILSIYGVQVCPFIESLPKQELAALLFGCFAVVLILKVALEDVVVPPDQPVDRPRRQLVFDLVLYCAAGLLFPWPSSRTWISLFPIPIVNRFS